MSIENEAASCKHEIMLPHLPASSVFLLGLLFCTALIRIYTGGRIGRMQPAITGAE